MTVRLSLEGPVARLLLDRPARANAYDAATLDALASCLDQLEQAPARAILVESAGEGAFCGGADLAQMGRAEPLEALDLRSQLLFTRLARLPMVSVAAVQGPAVAGGFELALACDLRVAGPRARFSLPETALGIIPSAGGCTRLLAAVGPSRAREVILAGRELDGRTALAWGLVTAVADDPRAEARALAERIALRDPVALRLAKAVLDAEAPGDRLWMERLSETILYYRKRPPPAE